MAANELQSRCLTYLLWIVLLQCIGLTGRYFFSPFEIESDLYGVLFYDWRWPETIAERIDDGGPLICLVFAALCLILNRSRSKALSQQTPQRSLRCKLQMTMLICIGIWILVIAGAHMVRGDAYSEWALAEYAVRYAAPLAAACLLWHRSQCDENTKGFRWIIGGLAVAASATFILHGYKALETYGAFTDLILLSDQRISQLQLSQDFAETSLVVIGTVDVGVGILLLAMRSPSIAIYMTLWGAITAASRMTAFGLNAWPETLLRAANFGVPFVLAVFYLQWNAKLANTKSANSRSAGESVQNETKFATERTT